MFCCFAWHWILSFILEHLCTVYYFEQSQKMPLSLSTIAWIHFPLQATLVPTWFIALLSLSSCNSWYPLRAAWLEVFPYNFSGLVWTRNAHPFPWASPPLCKARKLARIGFLLTFPFRVIDTGTPEAFLFEAADVGMNDACRKRITQTWEGILGCHSDPYD